MSTANDHPSPGAKPLPSPEIAAFAGLVAGALGLAVAHLVTAIDRGFRDPAVSVGDRLIDRVPPSVREWAIATFGTSDKSALLVGIYLGLVLGASLVGIVALRRGQRSALVAVAAFGVIGGWAAIASPTSGVTAAFPSIAGAAATACSLVVLRRCWVPRTGIANDGDRRRFLVGVGGLALLTVTLAGVGRALRTRLGVAGERLSLVLPRARRALAPPPAGLEADVAHVSPLFTPNDRFYRVDTALFVPNVSTADWRLKIHGMVGRELTLRYEDLTRRELIETDVTLCCVSNEVGGELVGNARWLGCRLDDLLTEVGIDPAADQVVGRSIDGWTSGFPVAALDGRAAIIAIGMNGEPLPIKHGYPARLVVPGLYGYVSATKWLAELELTRFDRFSAYWIPRGWAQKAPIKTQSRIDTPRGAIPAGRVAVAGVAWAGVRGIARVEVRTDENGVWREATLGPELAATTWRQWWLPWDATAGTHEISVRATDGNGDTQTSAPAPPVPNGATGLHTRTIVVN